MKSLAASWRVGICDEWKRTLSFLETELKISSGFEIGRLRSFYFILTLIEPKLKDYD